MIIVVVFELPWAASDLGDGLYSMFVDSVDPRTRFKRYNSNKPSLSNLRHPTINEVIVVIAVATQQP
jgi:hypothetical protein